MSLKNKIDFAVVIRVKNANPNGDPLNGNRPRTDYEGFGEISDVCLKRKIRNRMLAEGAEVFVQSADNNVDGMLSLKARAESEEWGLGKDVFDSKKTSNEKLTKLACAKWLDTRSFGQLFAFKTKAGGLSLGIRGPVTIQSAYSVEPVNIVSSQIAKSVNGVEDKKAKSSDTLGMKHRVDSAVYVTYGAMSPQLAVRTGFDADDAQAIKDALLMLFEGDASSARPEGSMSVEKLVWWEHDSGLGKYSSAKVHGSLSVAPDGSLEIQELEGLVPEVLEGR